MKRRITHREVKLILCLDNACKNLLFVCKRNSIIGEMAGLWLSTVARLSSAMVNCVKQKQLQAVISFKGFVDDRAKILAFLQSIDVFLFCHLSAESPRCLIESIISGTPLVGYNSAYAKDLVGKRGGALLSNIGDTDTIANQIFQLAEDPKKLARLTENIAKSSSLYHDQAVFQHRSDLIKTYL